MNRFFTLASFFALTFLPAVLLGQAAPTAKRTLQFAAFGLVSGNYTGLSSGRNLDFTLGGDIGFYHYRGVLFSAEVRGTYPIDKGQVVAEKSILAGVRAESRFSRAVIFGDVLAGRGGLEYQNGGYVVPPFVYYTSTSSVYGAGGGVEFDLPHSLALRAEAQVQRWATPVVSSGKIYSKQLGVGVVYRFGTNGRPILGVRD